ncbi:MAG TPA: chromosomal replication initiator protein DnaA [Thermotogae bacterium]|nr:chromosomal replication initiator protein DnaA [Thermotogota bacterium]
MKSRLLKAMKNAVSSKTWNTWFSSFDVLKIEGNTVIFQVTNPFIKDWLERKYSKTISRVVKEVLGPNADFKIQPLETAESESSTETGPLVKRKPVVLSELNPKFTFETFVVGDNNRFAYSAAVEVATEPGRFNPLFIYGGVGLGKTHLAQAIAHETLRRWPELRVIYITSEEFMNQMVEGLKNGQIQAFRERFRKKVDVLIIDDVQFLIDKPGIQTELFHTFNYLHDQGKQLVFCSDRDPTKLSGFHERLISRLKMGLVVEVDVPDYLTRIEVTRKFAEQEGIELSEKQLKKIAEAPFFNFRHVKGLIARMAFRLKVAGDRTSIDSLIDEMLGIPVEVPKDDLLTKIVDSVASFFGTTRSELLSRSRSFSKHRAALCYVLAKTGKYTLREISSELGRSKSTISYLVKRGKRWKNDPEAMKVVEVVTSMVKPNHLGSASSVG